jgi:hypothetical protein
MSYNGTAARPDDTLVMELVQELLDAHVETTLLAGSADTAAWQAHLLYLRDLQRAGHEIVAHRSAS